MRFDNLKRLGDRINVPIPKDEDGYLGRVCPDASCEGYFKIRPGTGLTGTDIGCHCPYCGHHGPHDRFSTQDQIAYVKSVALRQLSDAVRKDLKGFEFEHKPKGPFGIGISMKLKPGPPVPIRNYREPRLETDVVCDTCTLEYAVYGLFGYCPDCATHNSFQILKRNLWLVRRQLDLAGTLQDPDFQQHLIEDALENCVSAFDGFGREACRVFAAGSKQDPPSISFQNLKRASQRLQSLWGLDLELVISAGNWEAAHKHFMRRHLIAHRSGVVDQKYLDETGDPSVSVGRRLSVHPDEVDALVGIVEELGRGLMELLFKERPREPEADDGPTSDKRSYVTAKGR